MQQLADRKVLEKFGPPGLLIDEKLDVVQFRGETGPYLNPSPGAATLNALKLVRPELLVELRAAVQKALSEGLPVTSSAVPLWRDRETAVVLDVMPLYDSDVRRRCMLVLFRETSPPPPSPKTPSATEAEDENAGEPRLHAMERELMATKEYLQTSVQEAEASNEELQSSIEELQSSNEELQSTNEELETSKEELQSTNEELATVNDELQTRMAQLNVSNDDLQNILGAVGSPVVIVGTDLRIRRFSAAAERLLSLIPADVGRSIAYLATALNAPQVETVVADAINTVRERGQRVRCSDGLWYTMRVIPYHTADHSIRGAVMEFTRAPPGRKPGEAPEIHELVGKVLSTLPHILMVLDDQMRVVWVNKAFFEAFMVGAEVLGRSLDELWDGRSTEPALWTALDETLATGKAFSAIHVEHPFGRKNGRPMLFEARTIPAEGDRPALTLVVMQEGGGG